MDWTPCNFFFNYVKFPMPFSLRLTSWHWWIYSTQPGRIIDCAITKGLSFPLPGSSKDTTQPCIYTSYLALWCFNVPTGYLLLGLILPIHYSDIRLTPSKIFPQTLHSNTAYSSISMYLPSLCTDIPFCLSPSPLTMMVIGLFMHILPNYMFNMFKYPWIK